MLVIRPSTMLRTTLCLSNGSKDRRPLTLLGMTLSVV
jgi:hypothetical protein